MSKLKKKIDDTVKFIKNKTSIIPEVAIILGTGLDSLSEHIGIETKIEYSQIPNFSIPTVKAHKGELIIGSLSDKNVVAMRGRFHYYEGYSLEEVTFPVRVMKSLGSKIIIVLNAAGGLNPLFELSDLMLITDHINFTGLNPLIGPNDESLGSRFPDMSQVYDKKLIRIAEQVALEKNIKVNKGVYLGVTGPCLETAAEYRMMRNFGSDAVGMSTVPEVIVAVHAGFKILAISCITDLCLPDSLKPVNIKEILEAAGKAEPKLIELLKEVIKRL